MPRLERRPVCWGNAGYWARRAGWVGSVVAASTAFSACHTRHSQHPLEQRARRVVVACPKELAERGDDNALEPEACAKYCPKPATSELRLGCFHVHTYFTDELQRLAPGAEALMACEYREAK